MRDCVDNVPSLGREKAASDAPPEKVMRILFMIGSGRCGSTMIEEVLIRHPEIGFVSNIDSYLPLGSKGRFNSGLYRLTPARFGQRDRLGLQLIQKRAHFGPSEAYNAFNREVSPLVSRPWRDLQAEDVTPWLATRFRSFFERRLTAQRKTSFVHKFTGWPRTGFIHEIVPEAKFLHIIRDGRSVASSMLQRPHWHGYLGPWGWGHGPLPGAYETEWEASGYSFLALAAIDWKLMMDAFERAKARIPEHLWMDLRYEDFIEDPRSCARQILDFFALEWTEQFEKGFRKYAFSTSRRAGYKRDTTPDQASLLDQLLHEHLVRYGYIVDAAST
jgi:Sulfotransferase family